MAPHKTVTINGRQYDSVTGLPVEGNPTPAPAKAEKIADKVAPAASAAKTTPKEAEKAAPAKPKTPAASRSSRGVTNSEIVHSTVQRSQTLRRRSTKKPVAPAKPITKRPTVGRNMDIAKSSSVSRFAKHPDISGVSGVTKAVTAPVASPSTKAATKPVSAPKVASASPVKSVTSPVRAATKPASKPAAAKPAATPDKPARLHPLAQRAVNRVQAAKQTVTPPAATAKDVKNAAIAKALSTEKPKAKRERKKFNKATKRLLVIGGSIIAVLLIIFAAWNLIPSISVGVAAAQAGIQATYPEYTPDGYTLSQPVTFSDGEVDLKFTSNSNDNYYTIYQKRSNWDSSAVLDNKVTPAAGADYTTTKERGLTIYTYEAHAVWVNGGILYEIDSKAPLSGDQIRKIATSL